MGRGSDRVMATSSCCVASVGCGYWPTAGKVAVNSSYGCGGDFLKDQFRRQGGVDRARKNPVRWELCLAVSAFGIPGGKGSASLSVGSAA